MTDIGLWGWCTADPYPAGLFAQGILSSQSHATLGAPSQIRGPSRFLGSAHLVIQQVEISGAHQAAACPLRSSLPGVALVHLFSSKIG
jgi:hypothetical protein